MPFACPLTTPAAADNPSSIPVVVRSSVEQATCVLYALLNMENVGFAIERQAISAIVCWRHIARHGHYQLHALR